MRPSASRITESRSSAKGGRAQYRSKCSRLWKQLGTSRSRSVIRPLASTENPLGEMGYYVVSKGDLTPFRVKIRSASFNNVSIAPWILRGVYVPDIITILASLYFILGDIDR
jgi:NADH:ubiquinone oxidoreductase subunit D